MAISCARCELQPLSHHFHRSNSHINVYNAILSRSQLLSALNGSVIIAAFQQIYTPNVIRYLKFDRFNESNNCGTCKHSDYFCHSFRSKWICAHKNTKIVTILFPSSEKIECCIQVKWNKCFLIRL